MSHRGILRMVHPFGGFRNLECQAFSYACSFTSLTTFGFALGCSELTGSYASEWPNIVTCPTSPALWVLLRNAFVHLSFQYQPQITYFWVQHPETWIVHDSFTIDPSLRHKCLGFGSLPITFFWAGSLRKWSSCLVFLCHYSNDIYNEITNISYSFCMYVHCLINLYVLVCIFS